MATVLKDEQLAQKVYESLQAASCPLVDGLRLHDSASVLQLLCTPSQLRSDILAWICCSVDPKLDAVKEKAARLKEPELLTKEMASLGQELMLCSREDVQLIRGDVPPLRQLHFLQQLLAVISDRSAEHGVSEETLLNTLFAAENLQSLTQLLAPTLDPWPANIRALHTSSRSSCRRNTDEAASVASLLQATRCVLEQLQSECEFLGHEQPQTGVFSPGVVHVVAGDIQQLMATFCHVYETDLRGCCRREPPSFSSHTHVVQRAYELLLACNTELEMLHQVSEASQTVREEVSQLQTRPRCWSRGERRTLPDQLEDLNLRYRDFVSQLRS